MSVLLTYSYAAISFSAHLLNPLLKKSGFVWLSYLPRWPLELIFNLNILTHWCNYLHVLFYCRLWLTRACGGGGGGGGWFLHGWLRRQWVKVCQTPSDISFNINDFAKLGSGSHGTLEKMFFYFFIVKEGKEFVLTFCSQGDHFVEAQPEHQLEQTATTVQETQPRGN